MSWFDDLIHIAAWALQNEDLRHRYLHANSAEELGYTPGLAWCLETTAVLGIYEAALGKGYRWNKTIGYEWSYPNGEIGKTPKRADLVFKENSPGKTWSYIEVKCYDNLSGKSKVTSDIAKLRTIDGKYNQRWMLVYRIRKATPETKALPLSDLLIKNFGDEMDLLPEKSFPTFTKDWEEGMCDICLFRIL